VGLLAQGGDLEDLFQAGMPDEEEAVVAVALIGIVMTMVENCLSCRGEVE
jgi:hypothetical protein